MKCGRINLGLTWKTAKRIDKYCPCWRGQRNRCIQLLSDRLFARSSLWFTQNPEESLVSHELTSEVHLIKAKLSGRDYISHSLKCKSNEVITAFFDGRRETFNSCDFVKINWWWEPTEPAQEPKWRSKYVSVRLYQHSWKEAGLTCIEWALVVYFNLKNQVMFIFVASLYNTDCFKQNHCFNRINNANFFKYESNSAVMPL